MQGVDESPDKSVHPVKDHTFVVDEEVEIPQAVPDVTERVPPHRARPVVDVPDADTFAAFSAPVEASFHETLTAELLARYRAADPDDFVGHRVGERWVSSAGFYRQRMTVPGGEVPVAAVTAVSVQPGYRRRGLLRELMQTQLRSLAEQGMPVAVLWASEASIYGRFGYGVAAWHGKATVDRRRAALRPDLDLTGGSVDEVSRADFLSAVPAVHEAIVGQRPGWFRRNPSPEAADWAVAVFDPEDWRQGDRPYRYALDFADDGTPQGWMLFRTSSGSDITLKVRELEGLSPQSRARLWAFAFGVDLVTSITAFPLAASGAPVRHLLSDPRAVAMTTHDGLYARIVDVPAALAGRTYEADADVVVTLVDALLPSVDGTWRITIRDGAADVRRVEERAQLVVPVDVLGACYLGGPTLTSFVDSGRVQAHDASAASALSRALHTGREPFTIDDF